MELYIKWTEVERRKLSVAVRKERQQHPELSLLRVLNTVQEKVLPLQRQRKITSVQAVPWLIAELAVGAPVGTKLPEVERLAPVAVPPVTPEPSALAVLGTELNTEHLLHQVLLQLQQQPALQDVLPQLTATITYEVITALLPHIEAIVTRLVTAVPPTSGQHKKERKETILLINLKSVQFQEVVYACSGYYHLQSWNDGEDGYDRLKSLCRSAYKIFVPTKFCTHKVSSLIKQVNNEGYTPFVGATTTLINLLERLYCES